ncbi:hypothetical protein ABGB18_34445 [Nonomuraea sp. B12E4]|uniref:hypothetical protein n=1 Tax=Nonomuraea sp. B12E4 TaxID=3153564 RepID=UPI00325D2167
MHMAWIIAVTAAAVPQSPAEPATLTCHVATPAGSPLAFSPSVGLTPRRVTASGHLEFTGCVSPDGTAAALSSGWVAVKATLQTSCTSTRRVRGSAVITWFGLDSRPVGTSKLRVGADRPAIQRPADTLLIGSVTAGPLTGERARGGVTPATALLGCATQGMAGLAGSGRVTFG